MNIMRHLPLVATLLAGACVRAADPDAFSGHYLWSSNQTEAAALAGEVDATVATINRFLRPIARPRLIASTAPYGFIDIAMGASNAIAYARAGVPPVQAPLDGKPVKWEREGGVELNVAFEITADGRLRQTLSESGGTRVHLFTLAPGGTNLVMDVTINSKRLDRLVKYRLTYVKQPATK